MYQSIDDPQEELDALERGDKRMVIWIFAALCLGLIFAIVYWTSPGPPASPAQSDFRKAEQVTYRKAISEGAAPMRRARLQDFVTTYPESRYIRAVEAQLDVINAHETKRWAAVTDIVFEQKTPREDRLAALDEFETEWGGALLGGRESEIEALRAEILETQDIVKAPSRKLEGLKSPIPKTVPDTQLAGGPRPAITPRPVTIAPRAEPEPLQVVEFEIVEPKVRRRVKPRYPRKALRRKVGAVVEVSLNIDERGRVAMVEILDVDAERYEKDFAKAAERAALKTRFHPKTIDGVPSAASGIVKRYRFETG